MIDEILGLNIFGGDNDEGSDDEGAGGKEAGDEGDNDEEQKLNQKLGRNIRMVLI